jgi:hypothetical protein
VNQAIGKHDLDEFEEIQRAEALEKIALLIKRYDLQRDELAKLFPEPVAKASGNEKTSGGRPFDPFFDAW